MESIATTAIIIARILRRTIIIDAILIMPIEPEAHLTDSITMSVASVHHLAKNHKQ